MLKTIGLKSRLFFSHMLVMFISLDFYIIINRLTSFNRFNEDLDQLVQRQIEITELKSILIAEFETAWHISMIWSILSGVTAALLLSYWVARRITAPLIQIEQTTRKFADGQLDIRLPTSSIPEINRLSRSFNRMAMSLEQVEQKRRELIGDLAHELRTPMTTIRGYLEEIVDERIPPTADLLDRLIKEVRRVERLVMDLQLLSKAEAGHLPLHLQSISLNSLLLHVSENLSTQLREDGPTLALDCPSNLPPVWVDPDRTEQILVNLVGNALRYTEQGQIVVQVRRDDRNAWVTVADTGLGIAPKDLPHVFNRFWRSQHSRTRHSSGTGLGLAITQRLVELQGGTINVDSQLGIGSKFQFSLPLTVSSLTQ
ncbi:cell wall metabolism sensor histidine kinase WalK [Acaryochloris sp. CCMEE 5410]|uniref:sensor histidine kinase n=1 Tax=Acaryochloris sp. CCMEE 5410 TaxID=310037 RepID=UPI0002483CF4|nr:HAMP domain-containing sensor histidine kinase [Acaryochloris sp. CCMEE 5410]KAI9132061.1 HAMP domain-containing histidine kinase [Acaryochloris sp. CCMEE 5410]